MHDILNSEKKSQAQYMSIFNDHRRCLEILDGEDEEKRKLVQDNMKNIKMTFGKHKGKSFRDIFVCDTKWVWWACNKSPESPTIKLFKIYCDSNKVEKSIKNIMKIYVDKKYVIPERVQFRRTQSREMFCRLCDYRVEVKETITGDECSVCGFSFG